MYLFFADSCACRIIRPDLLTYLPEGSQVNNILLSNLHLGKAQLGYEGLLRDPLVNGRSGKIVDLCILALLLIAIQSSSDHP